MSQILPPRLGHATLRPSAAQVQGLRTRRHVPPSPHDSRTAAGTHAPCRAGCRWTRFVGSHVRAAQSPTRTTPARGSHLPPDTGAGPCPGTDSGRLPTAVTDWPRGPSATQLTVCTCAARAPLRGLAVFRIFAAPPIPTRGSHPARCSHEATRAVTTHTVSQRRLPIS